MKIGLPALFIGIGILLTSVLIQRIKAAKNDPYKDVKNEKTYLHPLGTPMPQ